MTADPARVRAIFLEAVEKHPPDTWGRFLDGACAGDAELRRHAAGLLDAHRLAGSFLAQGVVAPARAVDQAPVTEAPGAVIGPYKLLEQIGEGGFGVVFMAEQQRPVRRKVALKVLKPGMDTRQVIARFEAERQALALMDHPNIAHVFDGGETTSGRPYFAMELVRGVPMTDFCDANRLSVRERLDLFVSVCRAVQHAHLKGVIHRDLKPSNILVALHDGAPLAKVIDFGIAKATDQQLTEKTLFTSFAQMVGTPLYMSPEQAQMGPDVDTRADIYSLGVVLYELLTGTTPFDKERLRTMAYEEVRRIIREEEPARPSTRLSTLGPAAVTVSANRGSDPKRLSQLVRGELDWIVMKALEKDRNRRYETAGAFAADVQRYLGDEPVQACPPSAVYRVRKFARHNKRVVLALTAIFLLLIAGIAGTSWGLVRAEAAVVSERVAKNAEAEQRGRAESALKKAAREAAIAEAINDFFNKDILQLSTPYGQLNQGLMPDAELKIRTVLRRAAARLDGKFVNAPEVEMKIRDTIGYALQSAGDYEGAHAQYEKVVPYLQQTLGRDHPETLSAEFRLASIHEQLSHLDVAVVQLEQIVERYKAVLGREHPETFVCMSGLAKAYSHAGEAKKALRLAEQTLELRKRCLGPEHPDTLESMAFVAQFHRTEKALPLLEVALAGMRSKFPPLHPTRLETTRCLAQTYYGSEQFDRAIPLMEVVVPNFKTAYGIDDMKTQNVIASLIVYYLDMGRCDKAEATLATIQDGGANRPTELTRFQDRRQKQVRELIRRLRPVADRYQQALAAKKADAPDTLAARQAFGVVLAAENRLTPAAYHLAAVLHARQRLGVADDFDTQVCRLELGAMRLKLRKFGEAESLLLEAYAGLKRHEGAIPEAKLRATEALERLVQLYNAWGKKDKATEWRQKLEEQKRQ
jgi:serine/threonine protein kinase/tetratricopeptide (TPR) repeat protein